MNAGTCWGKNTIGPRGRSVEKAPGSDFTLPYQLVNSCQSLEECGVSSFRVKQSRKADFLTEDGDSIPL
jgi:hypothetical protein